jgi:undecaprenyl-diphosphatase
VTTGLRQDEDRDSWLTWWRSTIIVALMLILITIATTADVLADGLARHWDRELMFGVEPHRVTPAYVAHHGLHLKSGWQFWLWRTIVWGGQYWLLAALCGLAVAVVAVRRRRPWLLVAVGGWIIADQGAVWAFKRVVGRTFPGAGRDLLFTTSEAYPSGHSALGASCLIVLAALLPAVLRAPGPAAPGLRPKATAWLTRPGVESRASLGAQRYAMAAANVMAILVAVATVLLGYHWPTDAMAGWSYGILLGMVGHAVVRRYE